MLVHNGTGNNSILWCIRKKRFEVVPHNRNQIVGHVEAMKLSPSYAFSLKFIYHHTKEHFVVPRMSDAVNRYTIKYKYG
jgi:hypothetical protein